MTSRRAFLAGLAAMAAPLFARLALPRAPERKLLPCAWEAFAPAEQLPRIPHAVIRADFKGGHLWVQRVDGTGVNRWVDLGPCEMTVVIEA